MLNVDPLGFFYVRNYSNPNIDVYKFDQGCLVKLNSFDYGGVTYVPTAGDPFYLMDCW